MNKTLKEKELLEEALAAFQKNAGAETRIEAITAKPADNADALLRLTRGGKVWRFYAEIKTHITHAKLGQIATQIHRLPEKGILVADYVTPQIADRLKELNIPFIDTAGNVFFNDPPLFIFIKGQKPEKQLRQEQIKRALKPTGLRIVFALLCVPKLENAPYRDLAKAAGVALGTVNWVMRDLKEMGYLIDMGAKGRRLAKKQNLLERWVAAYPEQLKPKLFIGRYRAPDKQWWLNADIARFNAFWGGEVAAAKLTQYLKPELTMIYTDDEPNEFLLNFRLRKDETGDVEIFRKFWRFEFTHKLRITPPLLVYADLLATGEARNIETAKLIYDEELHGLVRED